MTSHKSASGFRDDWQTTYAAIYQAIERYDFKHFLREATDRGLLSKEETREIDPRSGRRRSRREMREHMLMLMLAGTERQQRFVQFVKDYAAQVQQMSVSALLPLYTKAIEFQSAEGQQELSQESFSSDDAIPMEFDATDNSDVGYYTADTMTGTISSNTPQFTDHRESMTSATDVDYLRRNLEFVRRSFRKHTAMMKQDSVSQQLPQSLSSVPLTSTTIPQLSATNNIHVTNHNQFIISADSNNYGLRRKGWSSVVQIPTSTSAQPAGGHIWSKTGSWSSKWRYVDEHFSKIIYTLNVKQLMPLLIEKGLLTPSEREELDKLQGLQHDQNKHLLQILPRKGEKSYELFLQCLREEEEHMGHQDILRWLTTAAHK